MDRSGQGGDPPTAGPGSEDRSIWVLHVDDDPDFLDLTTDVLEREQEDLSVTSATDASDALDRLESEPIDCIVSDYEMPGTDGLELLEAVRDQYPALPFVLYTGKGSEEIASEAISRGVTEYMQKEFGTEQYAVLANRIRNAVTQYRAERTVAETTQRLSAIVEASPLPIVYIDPDGTVKLWNAAAEDLFGWTQAEVLGEPLPIVPEEKQAEFARLRQRVLDGEAFTGVRIRRRTKEGEAVDLRISTAPIRDAERDVTGIMAVLEEVPERERALEELHAATRDIFEAKSGTEIAERVSAAIEEILDVPNNACWLYDEEKNALVPVAASPTARDQLGELPVYTPEDESISWDAFESGEVRAFDDVTTAPDVHDPDTPIRSEIVLPLGDHGVVNVGSTEAGTFDDVDRSLARILAANTETALGRVERERELEGRNERLDAFARVVTHDLRTPLAALDDAIGRAAESDDPVHVERCTRAVRRMEALIDDLQSLAGEDDVVEDRDPVALPDAVESSWRDVATGDATLDNRTDGRILAAADRLEQLLANLLANAVARGGPDATVSVGTLVEGFYVADDGPALPDDPDGDRLFASGHAAIEGDTGFGLSIVEQIARAHGWSVRLCDDGGDGARFEVTGVEFVE